MTHTITIRIDDELMAWLEALSAETGVPRGQIIREQLVKARREAHRNDALLRFAGVQRGGAKDVSRKKGFSR